MVRCQLGSLLKYFHLSIRFYEALKLKSDLLVGKRILFSFSIF
jgi:hypothetical protein